MFGSVGRVAMPMMFGRFGGFIGCGTASKE